MWALQAYHHHTTRATCLAVGLATPQMGNPPRLDMEEGGHSGSQPMPFLAGAATPQLADCATEIGQPRVAWLDDGCYQTLPAFHLGMQTNAERREE